VVSFAELYHHQLNEVLKWQERANTLHLENLKLRTLLQEYQILIKSGAYVPVPFQEERTHFEQWLLQRSDLYERGKILLGKEEE